MAVRTAMRRAGQPPTPPTPHRIAKVAAEYRALLPESQHAAILDIGGESSRPGSEPIALEEEIRRVIPIVKRIRASLPDLLLSVDTYKAETARQALEAADKLRDRYGESAVALGSGMRGRYRERVQENPAALPGKEPRKDRA